MTVKIILRFDAVFAGFIFRGFRQCSELFRGNEISRSYVMPITTAIPAKAGRVRVIWLFLVVLLRRGGIPEDKCVSYLDVHIETIELPRNIRQV